MNKWLIQTPFLLRNTTFMKKVVLFISSLGHEIIIKLYFNPITDLEIIFHSLNSS